LKSTETAPKRTGGAATREISAISAR